MLIVFPTSWHFCLIRSQKQYRWVTLIWINQHILMNCSVNPNPPNKRQVGIRDHRSHRYRDHMCEPWASVYRYWPSILCVRGVEVRERKQFIPHAWWGVRVSECARPKLTHLSGPPTVVPPPPTRQRFTRRGFLECLMLRRFTGSFWRRRRVYFANLRKSSS